MSELQSWELHIPGTPPSLNRVGGTSHWSKHHKFKKQWEGFIWIALQEVHVPKPLESITASAVLRFSYVRRRDEGNYRSTLEKALGDALQLGWIPDDTPRHFRFNGLKFDPEKGQPHTIIRLESVDPCLCDDPEAEYCPLHDAW